MTSVQDTLILPRSRAAACEARRFIHRQLGSGEQRELAELLVSELVTNAVSYSCGKVELVVRDLGPQIRVEVSDESATLPVLRAPDLEGGRGLHLVEAIADRWGVEERVDGKSVWFEISVANDTLQTRP